MTTRPDPTPRPDAPRSPTDGGTLREGGGPNEPILPMPGGDPDEKADAPWDLTGDDDSDEGQGSGANDT